MNIEYIEELSDEHSELHLYVEEHDAITGDEDHIGLRSSCVGFDKTHNVIVFEDGRKSYHLDADSVILAEPATEFPD
jgi:hypothetical protein